MSKVFFFLLFFTLLSVSGQKKNSNILLSNSIPEVENFLKTAHPDDPRRMKLKARLIALKNAYWTKSGSSPYAQTKPLTLEIPSSAIKDADQGEAEEFKRLIAEAAEKHSEKTVKLLNQLFDNDVTNKEAILLVRNNSDCNMILRIQGKKHYNLAVGAGGESSLVLEKGEYILTSNVCDAKYSSAKLIEKNFMIVLNKPQVIKPSENIALTKKSTKTLE